MKTLKTVLVGLLFTLLVLVVSAALILFFFYVYPPQLNTHDRVTKSQAQPAPKKVVVKNNNVLFPDDDGDGYTTVSRETFLRSCPSGSLDKCVKMLEQAHFKFNDCDDEDITVHPGAPELTDGKDNDCDGEVDERSCVEDADCVPPDGFKPFQTESFWSDGTYLFGCVPPVGSEISRSCRKCEDPDQDGFCAFTEDICSDGIDGDMDGLTDRFDPDCANLLPPP